MGAIATHHEFALPRGYVDAAGEVHTDGIMRLATARDEIEPLKDPEVRRNEAYLSVLLLSRTIVRIGAVTDVTPDVVEQLFAVDFDHLQRLYERINSEDGASGSVLCPDCHARFDVELARLADAPAGK